MIRLTVTPAVDRPNELTLWTFPDFSAFAEAVKAAYSVGAKEDSDLILAVAEWRRLHRSVDAAAVMGRIFQCDLDRKTDGDIDLILDRLQGLSYLLFSTHSHRTPKKDGLCCYRIIIELDQEYPPESHGALWTAVNDRLAGHLDPGAQSAAQAFYLPSSDCRQLFEFGRVEGLPLCVSEVLGKAQPGVEAPAHTRTTPKDPAPSLAALESVLASWARQAKDVERRATASAAKELLKGRNTVTLHEGRRNAFLTSLAGYLAAQFPDASGIADLFRGLGWDLFSSDRKYALDDLENMIERFQEKEQASKALEAAKKAAARAVTIAAASGGRSQEVTPEEVAHLERVFGVWQRYVIALYKRDCYFLQPDGNYNASPVLKENLFVAARDRLAVFGGYVEASYEDDTGEVRQKSLQQYLMDYSTEVDKVIFDLTRSPGWDAPNRTIYFQVAQPVVAAVGHEEVQDWLDLFDDHLCDYLSLLTKLQCALPALILTGAPRSGKTILARALGQVYGSKPVDASIAFANFNASAMVKQPVVFADEKMPEGYQREGTTWLRRFVTCDSRMLDEKYQARVELKGFLRFVAAANNLDIVITKEELSRTDKDAFGERLVHIDTSAGKQFLDKLGRAHIQRHWIDGAHIAEHIMYLAENWVLRHPGDRFEMACNRTRLHESMSSKAGCAPEVTCWLLGYLADRNRDMTLKGHPVTFTEGRLRVSSLAVSKRWKAYVNEQQQPSVARVGRALRTLAKPGRQVIKYLDGGTEQTVYGYEIDPKAIREENEIQGLVPEFDDIFSLTDPSK